MRHSDLPFGSEFSPSQIDLFKLLTIESRMCPEIKRLPRKQLSEIFKEAKRRDERTQGFTLEAIVIFLMRVIRLTYIGTRWRAGGDVQIFGESDELVLKRWQFSCTNRSVDEDQIATEVGLMSYLGCRVACVVSTKTFSHGAKSYTEAVRPVLTGALVLIDGKTLNKIITRPRAFIETILLQAPFALIKQR